MNEACITVVMADTMAGVMSGVMVGEDEAATRDVRSVALVLGMGEQHRREHKRGWHHATPHR